MKWTVEILRNAQKQLAAIPVQDRDRISDAILELGDDPRPTGSKKLSQRPGWRIRIGTYRVIYEIHENRLVVLVVEIGHRKDIYR